MMSYKLLDHGYLKLITQWGTDSEIIEAARMSTNKGFVGWGTPNNPGDEKLLRYLWVNKHHTPFEMCGFTIEVQAPIFVFREWHRHRVPFGYNEMCISGDSLIYVGKSKKIRTIAEIYRNWYEGVPDTRPFSSGDGVCFEATTGKWRATGSRNGKFYNLGRYEDKDTATIARKEWEEGNPTWRNRRLPSCRNLTTRILNENTSLFETAKMEQVVKSGVKELILLQTSKRQLKCTVDHQILTEDGWTTAGNLRKGDYILEERQIPPSLRAGIDVWTSMQRNRLIREIDKCYICLNTFIRDDLELDHVVPVVSNILLSLDTKNLKPCCTKCHRIKSNSEQKLSDRGIGVGARPACLTVDPFKCGEEMTYDITMPGPWHNYLANGIVVHNSARYTPLPNLNYIPTIERLMMGSDGKNKQAGTVKDAERLTIDNAETYRRLLTRHYTKQEQLYQTVLSVGIPKELARIHLPVGRYSRMRATSNLRGWLSFLTLRMHQTAQWEIRQYANAVGQIVEQLFPRVWELFKETMEVSNAVSNQTSNS